jgi:four helix bundle protein
MSRESFRQLVVWKKAIDLTFAIYAVTKLFPKDELFGLTSQLRRAAVSIPSNIAEGQSRVTAGEFRQFLGIATGSLAELQTQLIIARGLNLATEQTLNTCDNLAIEVSKMLHALSQSQKKV